jgi:hypothetical protein
MSASIATIAHDITSLDRLTSADPSAADLRYRAEFWQRYVATASTEALSTDQAARIILNCVAMVDLADRMEAPRAPVVQLVPVKKSTAPKAPAKPKMVSAAQFWTLHTFAVNRMIAVHGAQWKLTAPEETVETRLPAKLCSYVGPLGGKITWRRDQRIPAAKYWPNGELPVGVDLADPGRPMAEWATNGILERARAAQLEQIVSDRIWRGRKAIVRYWLDCRRKKTQLAAVCRSSMLAELARWRAASAPSNVIALQEGAR